ncbi:hypothetical protein ACTXJU_18460 [Glutamicibacter ardleyensis]|uniref:hypothetical protein n=1 Tax=Glutamicibacter ardleyensis TaxID=225894 RepID=UPI003FD566CF
MENSAHSSSSPAPSGRALNTGLTFVWVLLVARIITGLTISHDLSSMQSWFSIQAWIAPLGFAVIGTVIYWKNSANK